MIDVIVTAPINKHTIQSEEFAFPGHTEYIEQKLGDGEKALMILMKDDFRVALVTGHIPVKEIAGSITKELIQEKLKIFNRSLKQDFAISAPRIAVLSLNPHAGDGGLLGTEEQEIIIPAINEMAAKGMLCYGPCPADGLWAQITLSILMVSWPCITTRAGTVQGIGYGRGRELYRGTSGSAYFTGAWHSLRHCGKRARFRRFFPSGCLCGNRRVP